MYGRPIGTHALGTLSDGTIETKSHKILRKVAVGVVRESFQGTHIYGALRGHLCDSTAFLFFFRSRHWV